MTETPARALAAAALLALCGCASTPPPPEHLTRLWLDDEAYTGLSTEDGVLVLGCHALDVGDVLDIRFPFGNSVVVDWGRVDRCNRDLAVVEPLTARLRQGRLARELPGKDERLYLALRDAEDRPLMEPVSFWRGGALGNFVRVDGDAERVARESAGAGLYVLRDAHWEIVGLLAGITARTDDADDVGLGFIGLLEMARILPSRVDYFDHDPPPLRPDFEFGIPLQEGDIDLRLEQAADDADAPPDDGP